MLQLVSRCFFNGLENSINTTVWMLRIITIIRLVSLFWSFYGLFVNEYKPMIYWILTIGLMVSSKFSRVSVIANVLRVFTHLWFCEMFQSVMLVIELFPQLVSTTQILSFVATRLFGIVVKVSQSFFWNVVGMFRDGEWSKLADLYVMLENAYERMTKGSGITLDVVDKAVPMVEKSLKTVILRLEAEQKRTMFVVNCFLSFVIVSVMIGWWIISLKLSCQKR